MSNISRWFSPLDHRGMVLWGSISCLYLSSLLYQVQGELSEVWPNRCSMVRSALISTEVGVHPKDLTSSLNVVFDTSDIALSTDELKAAGLWSISSEGSSGEASNIGHQEDSQRGWLIPIRHYKSARVRLNRLTPIWIELISDSGASIMLIYEQDQSVESLYHYLTGRRYIEGMNELTTPLFLSRVNLEELAYKVTPSMISCDREVMDDELAKLLSLLLKETERGVTQARSWEPGVWEVDSEVMGKRRRVIHRRVRDHNAGEGQLGVWSVSWNPKEDEGQSPLLNPPLLNPPLLNPPQWLQTLLFTIEKAHGSPTETRELLSGLPSEVILMGNE